MLRRLGISIHLMLQFIGKRNPRRSGGIRISIHLMLQFIIAVLFALHSHIPISIHLMLQFIAILGVIGKVRPSFQYISCCSLSFLITSANYFSDICISIHLMLQFIPPVYIFSSLIAFISIHLMLQFIRKTSERSNCITYFNTSHVVVYLSTVITAWLPPSFQYISCCSLSHMVNHEAYNVKHFNTSHVVVYRMNQLKGRQEQNYFNTSHVVVYLATDVAVFLSANISIHLMLQFIHTETGGWQ